MSNIPNQTHRRSIRLKGFDYARAGLYFVTLCVQDRVCLFGRVVEKEMILNESGIIAQTELLKTNDIRPNVEIDSFVIMPNHVHCIISISHDVPRRGELYSPDEINVGNDIAGIHTGEFNELNQQGEFNSPLPPPPPLRKMPRGTSQTVGAIVRGYKSAVTKQLYALGFSGKLWQRNYYEHIIGTPESYERIANYIETNPEQWKDDKFYVR